MKWEKVNLKVEATGRGRRGGTAGPGNRWGHTCNALKRGRFLYVFGGYGNQDDRQTNEVHVFDTVKQSWSKPMVKGTPPSPRDSHTCTTVGTSLYVFGGTDGRSVLQDLYILDTVTNTWGKPKVNGEIPAPREGHSAALIGTNIFIFGGCGRSLDDEEDIYFNDLHMLDTVRLQWSKVDTKGKPPVPRDSHTCSTYESKLIVLGGTMEWRELQTAGEVLTPRAGHAAVTIGKLIFVFGGFSDNRKLFSDLHMLDLGTGMWSKVAVDGKGPSPRFSLAGDCVMGGFLVFIGGCNDNLVALDDMYYLDTEMQSEKSQSEKSEKFSMRKELKRKRQETQSLRSPVSEKGTVSAIVAAMNPSVDATNLSSLALLSHPGPSLRSSFYDFKPSEERVFEAKITNVFHYGYTIESVVDGKPLRGLLFCYKPGFANAAHAYLTKKKLDLNGGISLTKQNQSADSRLDKTNLPETSASTDSASAHNACYRETQLMDPTCITDHPQHLVVNATGQLVS
ncbi:hypothetical protein KP509_38G025100 [Ceratopteris richardii]|uniref:Uncharacterized protein n=1 Tax=Ceratopteris richardii TaxID=49495 RepID=A0A8T2Q356_CERRI|nr:hypothetical protein KP509_38G025100 [Ceratopteris richardii]